METVINIPLGGLANVPSEHDAPGGQLAAALNIINDDGAMRPIAPPTTVMQLDAGQRVAHVHKTADYTHFIVTTGNGGIFWCGYPATQGGKPALTAIATLASLDDAPTELRQVSSIGNTLVVLTDAGVQYFLWREGDAAYHYLGNKMPEVTLAFSLEGKFAYDVLFQPGSESGGDGTDIPLPYPFNENDIYTTNYQENNKRLWHEHAAPCLLKYIEDLRSGDDGYLFTFPFFVRYAYRLYDQSLVMHSAPMLMLPSSGPCPLAFVRKLNGGAPTVESLFAGFVVPICRLVVNVAAEDDDLAKFDNWEDIIESIDIFITPQVWSYKSSDTSTVGITFKKFDPESFHSKHFSVMKIVEWNDYTSLFTNEGIGEFHQEWTAQEALTIATNNRLDYPGMYSTLLNLPYKTDEEIIKELSESSSFYFVKSYKIKELADMAGEDADGKTKWSTVSISKNTYDRLAEHELMTDDAGSHERVTAAGSFIYNGRLNLFDIKKQLFSGYNATTLWTVTDGRKRVGQNSNTDENTWKNLIVRDLSYEYRLYYHFVILLDNGKCLQSTNGRSFTPPYWYFYPKSDVKSLAVYDEQRGTYADLAPDLNSHPFLNGTYWFGGFKEPEFTASHPEWLHIKDITTSAGEERLPNHIYSSEVNNPFVFPTTGMSAVGTGRVMALGAATEALSQGQFGQFPVYAFTDEGVWALSVGDDGQLIAAQPLSRDICNNASSVTSLDNALAFTTDAGLMLLQGSQVTCISDVLRGTWAELSAGRLQGFDKLLEIGGFDAMALDGRSLGDYLGRCDVAFDYPRRRIIAYSALDPVTDGQSLPRRAALVYSLRSGKWGMMEHSWTGSINSYPEAYTMTTDHRLVDLAVPDTPATGIPVFIATRAIALSSPDVLKTVRTVALRGDVGRRDLGLAVYGSRDLHHWSYIGSTRSIIKSGLGGSPYRFFKVVAVGTMLPAASLTAMDIEFFERMGGRLR